MRVPLIEWPITNWDSRLLERWTDLESKAAEMSEAAGSNDAFDSAVAELRNMASTGQFSRLLEILRRRTVARALTWLWLNDEQFSSKMLNPQLLETLLEAQAPRFTRMTLQQLAQLYFRRFDQLDKQHDVREILERILLQQLEKIPPLKIQSTWIDPLVTLKREASWLLTLDGPAQLAKRVQEGGRELGATFQEMGLQGFDDGRYGDVCRAHFYLDTLRNLPVGASDPVFEELQKQSVARAPFEGTRRIGHVALEILIDRSGQEASEAWQEFIINLAGDPRIASSAPNYREWWQPLGEERIQKVRGWLSKEDLRLFLQAVEQYGIEAQNDELQRMFPARKIFLEGLFKLKLIRNTRLLLGSSASQTVKRILGKDVKTSFAHMSGRMSDKAVIYLDCGDFHLVEGSHSFRIWVYLASPGNALCSYEKNRFSDIDLTTGVPESYKKLYPGLPYDAFTHHPDGIWQKNVFAFLANNGIGLDIEQLLSDSDYQRILKDFGISVVKNSKPTVNSLSGFSGGYKKSQVFESDCLINKAAAPITSELDTASLGVRISALEPLDLQVLQYFRDNTGYKAHYAADTMGIQLRKVNQILSYSLKDLCYKGLENGWFLTKEARLELDVFIKKQRSNLISNNKKISVPVSDIENSIDLPEVNNTPVTSRLGSKRHAVKKNNHISSLNAFELQLLRYFNDNPGDKARHAADVLGFDRSEVNRVLYSSLKVLCRQSLEHGWTLTESARFELENFDQ